MRKPFVMSEIHLGITFDQNYLNPFYALLTSVFENNKNIKITVHAIVSGISEDEKSRIVSYGMQNNCSILYYKIDDEMVSRFVLTGKWTPAVYYRLFFPLIVPENVRRLLYLDTDTLVLNDLSELYSIDLEEYPVGAVYDNWVKKAPYLGIFNEGNYFNSGVLLIDIEKWKGLQVSENAMEFLSKYPEKIKFVDQDALNAVLINNWQKLDQKYNFMYSLLPEGASKKHLGKIISDKVVLHFTLQRPWFLLCKNRFRNLYFYYLQKSPARGNKKVIDFSWDKLPALINLRILELYFDIPFLQTFWRKIKG